MHRPLVPHGIVLSLVAAALLLPITICVIFGTAALLTAMGDITGGAVLYRIALGCGIIWVIDLIGLVLLVAIGTLRGPHEPEGPE
jgi:hypothetical protein